MRKFIFTAAFLFICGATFYYIDPLELFTIADEQLQEMIESDFELPNQDDESGVKEQQEPPIIIDTDHGVPRAELFDDFINQSKRESMSANLDVMTVASILGKYEGTLESLKTQVDEKLNALLEHAYEEYLQSKENGKANLALLYLKYKKLIDELESNTDRSFEEVYEQLLDELSQNGHDISEAEEIKQQYEEMKEKTKAVMMEQVMDKFEV